MLPTREERIGEVQNSRMVEYHEKMTVYKTEQDNVPWLDKVLN